MCKIFLNHAYIVVGHKIFQALRSSEFFMNDFANVDYKTSVAVNLPKPWTGLYLRGKNTYLEIFDEFDGRQTGDYGFGFGIEEIGGLKKLYPDIKSHYPNLIMGDFQQPIDASITKPTASDKLFTSFKYILFPKIPNELSAQHLDTFIMEYTPEVFDIKNLPSRSNQENDISRNRYNSKSWNPQRYLLDIESITVSLETEVFDKFTKTLATFLHHDEKNPSIDSTNNTISFKGEDFTLHLQKTDALQPLNFSISMSLKKPVDQRKVYTFDQAQLVLETNGKAILSFAPESR